MADNRIGPKPLTKAQKRVMVAIEAGKLVRRRGAFGTQQSDKKDDGFAASRTLDKLWAVGLIEPAETWGAFKRKEA